MKNRFLLRDKFLPNTEAVLSPEESYHLARVLRMENGEGIELIDGKGRVGSATILEANAKRSRVSVASVREEPKSSKVTVVFGIPKANACDFILHRCTEAGVGAFQPVISAHSLHPKEWNQDRWEKVVEETCKQCQESWFPEVRKPLALSAWLSTRGKLPLLYCFEEERKTKPFIAEASEVQVLIGPEGGWSQEEVRLFQSAGGSSFGLGKNRLRAETAALVATTLLKQAIGEF